MPDTGGSTEQASLVDHELPKDYAAAITALMWQAGDHRRRAARLRMQAADQTAEAAHFTAAAGQCHGGADSIARRNEQAADSWELVEPSAALDLLLHRAREHREAAEEAQQTAIELADEAETHEELAAGLELNADFLRQQPA
jgi:hypothetical protein